MEQIGSIIFTTKSSPPCFGNDWLFSFQLKIYQGQSSNLLFKEMGTPITLAWMWAAIVFTKVQISLLIVLSENVWQSLTK